MGTASQHCCSYKAFTDLHKELRRDLVASVEFNKLNRSQILRRKDFISVWQLLSAVKLKKISLAYEAISVLIEHVKND